MTVTSQAVMDALAGVAYAIDLDGRITSVGRRGWRLFAVESGAPELADTSLFIDRPLFDFITGEDVRAAYGRLLERVRLGEPLVALPCHCDGPTVAREMRMTISPLKRGRALQGYLFQSIPVSEHIRPPIQLFAFATEHYPDTVPLLGMCSLCERVCAADSGTTDKRWMEAERYYANGGSSRVRISHTVCPDCFSRWVQGWTGLPPPEF
jgi:hypothetical protein